MSLDRPRRTRRYPDAYWRHFHLVGTEPFEMAGHLARPRGRAEDVQARVEAGDLAGPVGSLWRQLTGQGLGSDGNYLSDHRHSGSRARRVLDPSGAGEGRDREPRGGRGLDRGVAAPPARQDRQDRRRGAAAGVAGVQARRAAGVFDGAGSRRRRTRTAAGFVANARR